MFDKMFSTPSSHLRTRTSVHRRTQLGSLLLVVTISVGALALLYFSRPVAAVNRTWDGGGATNNWSDAANWSGDIVPGSGDTVIFDGTSTKDATIDTDFSVDGIQINSGYTGTISQAPAVAFSVGAGRFQQSAGSFVGSSGDIHFNSGFTLSGTASFTAASGTTFYTTSRLTVTGTTPVFNHNGGTVVFDGQSELIQSDEILVLNNVIVNKNDGHAFASSPIVVTGALSLNDGLSFGSVEAQGSVTISPNFDGGPGQIVVTSSAARTITIPAGTKIPNITLNAPNVTINTPGPGTLAWQSLTMQAGTVNQGNTNFTFSDVYTQSVSPTNAAFVSTFNASGNPTTFNEHFNQLAGSFVGGSGDIHFNGFFSLSGTASFTAASGTTSYTTSRLTVTGTTPVFNHNGGTVVFDGQSELIQSDETLVLNNVTVNKNDGNVLGGSTIVVTGALNLTDGVMQNMSITADGSVTVGPNFDGGSGVSITFGGSADQTFTNSGGVNPTGTWTINKTAGVVTLASDLTLDTSQALNITSGMLNQGASFSLTAGTITIGASGVLRNFGTGDLTIGNSVSNAGLIDLDSGGPTCGDADLILIRSSSPGMQRSWSVSGTGKFRLQDVDVQDQAGTAAITVFSGTDHPGTNGMNWAFSAGCAPTEVTLESFAATSYEEGLVLLQWHTGFEVRNLGFNAYREEGGKQVRINPSMLAGSALVTGLNTALTAGRSYSWIDKTPGDKQSTQYWLEDVDLNGQSTWHGPVAIQKSEVRSQRSEADQQALTLSEIGDRESPDSSHPLEAKAQTPEINSASIQAQAALASQPAAKIAVKREGWYRITQTELDAAGFNTKVDPRLLQLFVDGSELPIIVSGERDGSFDSTDAIEFYGVGVDSPFTDSRVYWLVAGNQNGLRIKQAKTDGMPSSSQSFTATVERRDRTVYFSGLRNGEKENFFGAIIARDAVDQQLTLPHLVRTDSNDAQLDIAMQGVTVTDHRVSVELNGAQVGEVVFYGQSQGASRFNVSQSLLREGSNVVRLTPLAGGSDVSLVDYLRVSYQHSYAADNDVLKLMATGKQQITIDGFTSKSIRVFDVSDASAPEELTGEIQQRTPGYAVTFAPPGEGQRVLLALTIGQAPPSVTLNQPSNLHKGKANFLIFTRREFADSLKPLVALRENQGSQVAVVDIEDIYDEFSFGQKTPFAVRDFLAYAKSSWKKKPRFVLFAGDASLDPKNYLGFGDSDLVPTKLIDTDFMETASDDWFTDFDGDGVADIATGRLPARTVEELSTMVSKIISYEQSGPADEALLVADANEGFDFEQASAKLRSLIPGSLRITQVNRGRVDAEMARSSLFEALNRKQFLVNYAGHGSVSQWKANLLTNDDASGLRNDHLPMFVMMTCLNGYFHDPALDSLGESLMKAERGGAVAVWASSGMTLPGDQALVNQELYRLLFGRVAGITIGEAAMRAKAASSNADVRRTWILLGDPAMKLK